MHKVLIVSAVAVALAATVAGLGRDSTANVGRSLIAGVILGSQVWPYGLSALSPESQTSLLLGAPDCSLPGQCDTYGLASTASPDRQDDTAE